jgi:hypothetical protein
VLVAAGGLVSLDTWSADNVRARGVLPLLQAMAAGRPLAIEALDAHAIEHALQLGLGPVLAYVIGDLKNQRTVHAHQILAADLTARVLTHEKLAAITKMLCAAEATGCRMVLLKGAATALRYYPSPHLRTMGDVDVLVPIESHAAFEARLLDSGFVRQTTAPGLFDGRHHGVPLWHPEHDVWVDVHRALHPRQHPLGKSRASSIETLTTELTPIAVRDHTAYVMSHELQLVYTSARWLETFDSDRGVHPILDAALLLRRTFDVLDWDRVLSFVQGSWAATAVRVVLLYLTRREIATVPRFVLNTLARFDRHANWLSIRLLHRLTNRHIMQRQSGPVVTLEHANIMWNALVQPASPLGNLIAVPYHLAFPPREPQRFHPMYAARRVRSLSRRLTGAAG